MPCPSTPSAFQRLPSAPRDSGFVQVGDLKAEYREWVIKCAGRDGSAAGSFVQRTVLLPTSKILIVDNRQTPGLLDRLEAAEVMG